MLKKRLFSIACAITIATAMCAVTGCGSSQSSGASQQGAGKVDYSALPKIDMPDKKIVLLTQSEEKATTYKEHYGGEVESILSGKMCIRDRIKGISRIKRRDVQMFFKKTEVTGGVPA